MTVSEIAEPAIVLALLVGGTIMNRDQRYKNEVPVDWRKKSSIDDFQDISLDSIDEALEGVRVSDALDSSSCSPSPGSLSFSSVENLEGRLPNLYRVVGHQCRYSCAFKDRFISRLVHRFPFLIEVWYWILIYWVYQLGRAFTAITMVDSTIHIARRHALQLIRIEKRLHIFWEQPIQAAFLAHPLLLHWINRVYSYVHIPASISFLIWLYYVTTTCNGVNSRKGVYSHTGPLLYEARRRTMAMSNLLAFIVFTIWPCMPPRLLSDSDVEGRIGAEARSYGFVDTVHGKHGESSVWTQNRFCNQYAAMPSLHFGYALLIGLTIATIPLSGHTRHRVLLWSHLGIRLKLPSILRLVCVFVGLAYILTILTAIIVTANHFILDALAGAIVCAFGWFGNEMLLSLIPLENLLLWCLRICKPRCLGTEVETVGLAVDLLEDDGQSSWF